MKKTSGLGKTVLLVEDDEEQKVFVEAALASEGYQVTAVNDARVAVQRLNHSIFDAVVSDLRLPEMTGADLLRYVRLYRADLPFIMLTGYNDVPTAVRSMQEGADEYLLKPVTADALHERIQVAIEQRALFADQVRQAQKAKYADLIGFLRGAHALVNSLETKDPYTQEHSKKVAHIATTMASRIPGMDRFKLREIRLGALLHDIGKIGVPLTILHKNGPLTDEEWEVVKLHPIWGERIVQPIARSLPEVARIVRSEHERWDGRGYPDGLKAEAIPVGARLVMIADTYDAICSTRPYRKALSKQQALECIRDGAGSQFDPGMIPVFKEVLPLLPEPRD